MHVDMNDSKNKTIHIAYYALLREERGLDCETITTNVVTALDLYNDLRTRHHFSLSEDTIQVSINDTFHPWQTELKDEDHIVFIPPVSGG